MGKIKKLITDTEYENIAIDIAHDSAVVIPDEVYEEAILTTAQLIRLKRGKSEDTDVQ